MHMKSILAFSVYITTHFSSALAVTPTLDYAVLLRAATRKLGITIPTQVAADLVHDLHLSHDGLAAPPRSDVTGWEWLLQGNHTLAFRLYTAAVLNNITIDPFRDFRADGGFQVANKVYNGFMRTLVQECLKFVQSYSPYGEQPHCTALAKVVGLSPLSSALLMKFGLGPLDLQYRHRLLRGLVGMHEPLISDKHCHMLWSMDLDELTALAATPGHSFMTNSHGLFDLIWASHR